MTDIDGLLKDAKKAAGGPRPKDDLVENLRQKARGKLNASGDYWGDWLCEKAAAEIERLRAENARLQETERNCWTSPEAWTAWCDIRVLERAEAERDDWRDLHEAGSLPYTLEIERLQAENNALRADAERYRWLRINPTFMGWEHDFQPDFVDKEVDRVIATDIAIAREKP